MRDRRGDRRHLKKVRRARKKAYTDHNGGCGSPKWYGYAAFSRGRQRGVRTAKTAQWVGTDRVRRDGEWNVIQAKKERRRAWHEGNRIATAARMFLAQAHDQAEREVELHEGKES